MTQESLDRLVNVLDSIQGNLENQSTQIKNLTELLRPLAQPSTGHAAQEPAKKDGKRQDHGNKTATFQKIRSAEDVNPQVRAVDEVPAQANDDKGRGPPTPQTIFYSAGTKAKYALGRLPFVYSLHEKAENPVRGGKWSYSKCGIHQMRDFCDFCFLNSRITT